MKAMLKKGGVYAALSAVLLLTVVLVTSCPDPYAGSYKPPAGMGYVKLNIDRAVGRTILPGSPSFTSYDLQFKDSTNANVGASVHVLVADIGTYSHPLPPGTYTVVVTANTAESPVAPAATGTSASFIITTGSPSTVNVTLTLLDPYDATGTGTFDYTFTFDTIAGSGTADMTITAITGGGGTTPSPATIDVLPSTPPTTNGSITGIDAGYYYVDIVMNVPTYTPVTFRQILHVYQGMTSTWAPSTFSDALFLGDSSGSAEPYVITPPSAPSEGVFALQDNSTNPLAHGDTVTLYTDATETISINGTVSSGYAWYCNSSTPLDSSASYTIDPSAAPFDKPGTYLLTIEGIDSGIPYSTFLIIEIVQAPVPAPSAAVSGTPTNLLTIDFGTTAPTPPLAYADLIFSATDPGWVLDADTTFTDSGTIYTVGITTIGTPGTAVGTLQINHPNIIGGPTVTVSTSLILNP